MLSDADLAAIKTRLNDVWHWYGSKAPYHANATGDLVYGAGGAPIIVIDGDVPDELRMDERDVRFITNAPSDINELLTEVEQLRDAVRMFQEIDAISRANMNQLAAMAAEVATTYGQAVHRGARGSIEITLDATAPPD